MIHRGTVSIDLEKAVQVCLEIDLCRMDCWSVVALSEICQSYLFVVYLLTESSIEYEAVSCSPSFDRMNPSRSRTTRTSLNEIGIAVPDHTSPRCVWPSAIGSSLASMAGAVLVQIDTRRSSCLTAG